MTTYPDLWDNAARMLLRTADRFPDQLAVVESDRTIDFAALAGKACSLAVALQSSGLAPGDRVGVLLRRGADSAAAFFGVLAAGAAGVMVNDALRPRQIDYILEHAGIQVLLSTEELLERLPRSLHSRVRVLDVAALAGAAAPADWRPAPKTGADLAQIIYTSGSTGLPKGVALSHANLWAGMHAVVSYLSIGPQDRIASLLPFSFDYGLNQLLCCAGTGATLVVENTPVPQRIVATLARQRVTVLPAVPPLWLQLLNVAAFRQRPLDHLRAMTNTGGRLPAEAVRKLRSCQPDARLFLMYGLTEAFRSTYLDPSAVDDKPNSIGRAIPGAEVLVVNEAMQPCAAGEVGQLIHRGPTVALGYYNDPEATAEKFRPHPLRPDGTPASERVVFSGDLVWKDADGDLHFAGRQDGLIKTLGHRVSPDEITEVLYDSGEVVEAVITTEPDELRGARIIAHVVLTADGDPDRLATYAARELPRYMQPSSILVRQSLPRTASGKHDAAAAAGMRP